MISTDWVAVAALAASILALGLSLLALSVARAVARGR